MDARRERDGFTILVTCPDALLPAVRIDEEAMTRVFVNLLDNAMKYSGRSRRIRVDLSCRDEGVAVAVSDFGIGIAPEEHERIFDRFYRTTAPADDGVAGTGLGLAIVRQVVHAHGGRVEVDSRPGRGATFTVVIPAAGASAVRAGVDVPARRRARGWKPGPGLKAPDRGAVSRILIVEDDRSLATALSEGLQYEGHVTLLARDGAAGLRLAGQGGIDLVILDVMLPGVDGVDVCRGCDHAGARSPSSCSPRRARSSTRSSA